MSILRRQRTITDDVFIAKLRREMSISRKIAIFNSVLWGLLIGGAYFVGAGFYHLSLSLMKDPVPYEHGYWLGLSMGVLFGLLFNWIILVLGESLPTAIGAGKFLRTQRLLLKYHELATKDAAQAQTGQS